MFKVEDVSPYEMLGYSTGKCLPLIAIGQENYGLNLGSKLVRSIHPRAHKKADHALRWRVMNIQSD
jgi:hypothetical protein